MDFHAVQAGLMKMDRMTNDERKIYLYKADERFWTSGYAMDFDGMDSLPHYAEDNNEHIIVPDKEDPVAIVVVSPGDAKCRQNALELHAVCEERLGRDLPFIAYSDWRSKTRDWKNDAVLDWSFEHIPFDALKAGFS